MPCPLNSSKANGSTAVNVDVYCRLHIATSMKKGDLLVHIILLIYQSKNDIDYLDPKDELCTQMH